MSFVGKTVLITGAAGGIGRAAARAFQREGANLVLVDLSPQALDRVAADLELDLDGDHLLVVADVSQEDQVERYLAAGRERFGAIDVFFNNAGVEGATGPLIETTAQNIDLVLDVNVKGSFFGIKHVMASMIEQGHGAIVNTSSMAGLIGFAGLGVYTASKHAVLGLTRAAAMEAAGSGVRVNAICPGPVNTRMMRGIESGMSAEDPEGVKTQFAALTGLNRYAEPEEIAELVVFLASDKASYITGSVYTADGGMTGM